MNKVRILIAVQPPSLLRVIEHLLGGAPELQIVSCLQRPGSLEQQSRQLQPDLIIVNASLLGEKAGVILATIKRASPRSKLILTSFDTALADVAGQWGADMHLEEEVLVKRLLQAARRLTVKSQSAARPERLARTARRLDRSRLQ